MNKRLKQLVLLHRNIDYVDKTMDEVNEQTENMRQIQEALSAPIGSAADFDEVLQNAVIPAFNFFLSNSLQIKLAIFRFCIGRIGSGTCRTENR